MLLECVQTVAGWLSDPVTGVNALRASVPRYAGDAEPPAVTVVQMFRDGEAARGQMREVGLPVLEVGLWQDPAQETSPAVRPFPADAELQVQIRYGASPTIDTALAVRQTALTFRCVTRAIAARAIGGTTVNDVHIMTASNLRTLTMYVADGDTVITGALLVTLRVRDLWTHPI